MTWSVTPPSQLSNAQRVAWDRSHLADPQTDSFCFRPEWVDALEAVGRPARVAVWTENNEPVAFLPFEQHGSSGHPAGRMISDYQGLIGDRAVTDKLDVMDLLRQEHITDWHFDHVLADQTAFAPFQQVVDSSPYIDLAHGLDAYQQTLSKSGRSDASAARRKSRKLAREVGDLTLTWHSTSQQDLAKLFEWKSAQYHSTQVPDVFATDWTRDLLGNLLHANDAPFAGAFSTLHAGDQLVALHFGMRSHGVLHWWFPTYDPAFGRYSPGRVMLQLMIDEAHNAGVTKIDLGKGTSSYKQRTMSGQTLVAVGVVEPPSLKRFVRLGASSAKNWLKKTPLRRPLSAPARWVHHYVSRKAMQ